MIVSSALPYQSPVATTRRADDVVKDKSDANDKPTDTTAAQFCRSDGAIG